MINVPRFLAILCRVGKGKRWEEGVRLSGNCNRIGESMLWLWLPFSMRWKCWKETASWLCSVLSKLSFVMIVMRGRSLESTIPPHSRAFSLMCVVVCMYIQAR